MEHLSELWDRLNILKQALDNMGSAEGLKPLRCFSSLDEMLSLAGETFLQEMVECNKKIRGLMNEVVPFINAEGNCHSLNYDIQPVIGVVYGPTGCGKSQLLRNLISSALLNPPAETVFFIVPQIDMIPPQEMTAWQTQICEGNYSPGANGTVVPRSSSLMPRFIKMSYEDLTLDHNYDVSHPENVFSNAASRGPIAIIMDECMENLGGHKGVAKFFHAFPSKLHDRYPKCTGYNVFVVLHNMNPRKDLGGNISNLKIQAKVHLISPKMHPSQISRFVNNFTKGLPLPISLLLKDIINFHSQNSRYDWIVYNTAPPNDALQWCYLHPTEGLMPMYLNVQCCLYSILTQIHKLLSNRQRWNKYYKNKNTLN